MFDGLLKKLLIALCIGAQAFALWADVDVPLTQAEKTAQAEAAAEKEAEARKVKVAELQTNPRMAEESRIVAYCLERMHYLRTPIKRLNPSEVIDAYLDDLDPARLFFLKSDVDHIKERFAPTLDVFLQQGNLLPAFSIFQIYRDRVRERCEWVEARLKEPFDFSVEESFKPDRKEAPWIETREQADALWQQRLKFELLNESLAPNRGKKADAKKEAEKTAKADTDSSKKEKKEKVEPKTFEERLAAAEENLSKRYARFLKSTDEIEATEVQEVYLNSVAAIYDPHSGFLSPYFLDEFDISMRNSLVGIGAVLSEKDGYCTIRELVSGGPAARSGQLHAGDKIVGVAQGEDGEMTDVVGVKLRKVVRQIRGKKGTVVRILVQPAEGDPSERSIITMERDEIKLTDNLAKAKLFEVPAENGETVKVGVIDLPSFYGAGENDERAGTSEDVKQLIQKLKEKGMQSLVLDVRRNGGGYLNEAIDLTGLLVAGGPLLQVRDTAGKVQELRDRMKNALAWNGPLVLLVSKMSASATEIVAGALQNHNRAVIVGDSKTHGKGTVQAVYPFENLMPKQKGAAKVTIQKWYLPDGNSIQVKGISSDIALPSSLDALPIAEGDLKRALPWDAIPALKLDARASSGVAANSVSDELLKDLGEYSAARRERLPEFSVLDEQVNWNRSQAERKEFSLLRAQREKERAEDTAVRDRLDDELDELAASNYKSEEFKLSVVDTQPAFNPDEVEPEEGEDAEFAKKPVFDIRLREGLRVAADWYALSAQPPSKETAADIVAQKTEQPR